jgi:glycosyltransferase involved in cell wall biosynthesis
MDRIPLTVVMITLNEEAHLPGAIQNVKDWAEEIFIVDSCSKDRTVDIALEAGVRIVQRPFTTFSDQWNFALEELPINTPWTMKLDPDERLSDELKASIARAVSDATSQNGYRMTLRLWFMGRPLHVDMEVLRLWRTGKCRFPDVFVNEHAVVEGSVGHLPGMMEHLDSPTLYHWLEKQNRYTTMEAFMRVRGDSLAAEPRLLGTSLERRMFFKRLFFWIPFRYPLLFIYHLLWKGVWRDGRAGWAWARLRTEVYRLRELKSLEMRWSKQLSGPPLKSAAGTFDERILNTQLQRQLMTAPVTD